MKRHVVLLGLPGSGKSTVGPLLARELRSGFHDLDEWIERSAGKSIAAIFEEDGEAVFRNRERTKMLELLAQPPTVIAAGGGWAAWDENLSQVRESAFFVYLRTSVAVAARRAGSDDSRPLLTGYDREERMGALLTDRGRHYERADVALDTDERSAAELAREVARLARAHAGW